MTWFMSYVQVYRDGRFKFGCAVAAGEHPLLKAKRWNESYGATEGFQIVVLSFQPVGEGGPETDTLSHVIS